MQSAPSFGDTNLDWIRVGRWQQDLAIGRVDRIRTSFAMAGLGGVDLAHSPDQATLKGVANRFLLEYWLAAGQGGLPRIGVIDPIRLRPALGRVLILEPVEDGRDFRYRLFGTRIAAMSGVDLTGKLASDDPQAPAQVCLTLALCGSQLLRPEPTLVVNTQPLNRYARWERLLLPFAGADGKVARVVIGVVGFGRDGHELHG
jgi:hypothetical protein